MTQCITTEDVWKQYGNTLALKNITTKLCRGLNLIVGPNGSGKTTLLKLITGLARPTRGRVISLGLDPWRERDRLSRKISVAFESFRLPWWFKGLEVFRYFSVKTNTPLEAFVNLANRLGLNINDLKRRISGYSMGMRKKIILSFSLAVDADAYILDEPYTLLDVESKKVLDDILLEKAKDSLVIVASHIMTRALERADKMVVLDNGVIRTEKSRRIPSTTYKCRGDTSLIIKLLELQNPKILYYEDGEVLVEFSEERDPPLESCEPILRFQPLIS